MRKKLKLGFAMGGGVSLGTFSGSALTEAIKQYMVYGKDENGIKYDDVIIDVFSGASAGAISLLVMLRGLFHYEDKLLQLTSLDRFKGLETKEEVKQKIKDHLAKQFGDEFGQMSDEKKEKLIAVQATQELQRLTWVKEAKIENIARLDKEELMLSKGSLLDRDFLVQDMASKAIYFDNDKTAANAGIKPVGPLADRVLYACTLTRIEPRLIRGEEYFKNSKSDSEKEKLNRLYRKILVDGASSKTHKDLRIFDICFDELDLDKINAPEKHPLRWINVHAGKSIKNTGRPNKNLWSYRSSEGSDKFRQERTWIEMVCTAMAAGSFPIAFEPVILKRYRSELTSSEKKDLDKKGHEYLRFSYIDGGTFNNEPISEAFKLAGFIDNQDSGIQGEHFDRRIIFVDPNVEEPTTINNYDYLREFKLNPYDKKATKRTGLNKISQLIPPLISMLRNEGSVVELDKAKEVINKFEVNDNLKVNYVSTIRNGLPSTFDKKLIKENEAIELDKKIIRMRAQVEEYLEQASDEPMIPRTYRKLHLAIRKHIVNDINSKTGYFPALYGKLENLKEVEGYKEFYEGERPFRDQPPHFQDWLILLYFTLLEVSQNLSEKNKLSKIIPIGPVSITDTGEVENVELKGSAISRFYGFFSEEFRTHDFNTGIYSAIEIFDFLNNGVGNRRRQVATLKNLFPAEKPTNEKAVNEKLYNVIEKRIFDELLKHNLIEITSDATVRKKFFKNIWDKLVVDRLTNGYLKLGFWFAKNSIKKSIRKRNTSDTSQEILLEFRIKIKEKLKKYVVTDDQNSRWISDIKPIFIKEDFEEKGSYYFVIILKYQFEETKGTWINWEGKEISTLKIAKDRKLLLKDKITHRINLPKHDFVKEKLENGLYNYFRLDLEKLKPDNPWEESREEASSLAGLIFGKRITKK